MYKCSNKNYVINAKVIFFVVIGGVQNKDKTKIVGQRKSLSQSQVIKPLNKM